MKLLQRTPVINTPHRVKPRRFPLNGYETCWESFLWEKDWNLLPPEKQYGYIIERQNWENDFITWTVAFPHVIGRPKLSGIFPDEIERFEKEVNHASNY